MISLRDKFAVIPSAAIVSAARPQRVRATERQVKNKAAKLARMIDDKLENMHRNAREWLSMFSDSKMQTDIKVVKGLAT